MPHEHASDRLIIANCSGFFGDRFSAMKEMVEDGEIHVLTGDYLAELTMAILFQKKLKSPEAGYVPTFLKQMGILSVDDATAAILEKDGKIIIAQRKSSDHLSGKWAFPGGKLVGKL